MVERNKIIYLILGIGIGIIMTNILNSAYPKIEYIELSDDKIIEQAIELGMVKVKENIQVENNDEDNLEIEEDKELIEEKNIEEKIIKEIVIGEGVSLTTAAELLYNENLINNVEEFIFFVRGRDLDKKINVGTYNIESGSTYTEIISTITHRN